MVPSELIEGYMKKMEYPEFCFFMALLMLAHRYSDEFYCSDERISKKFGISKRTISRCRKQLELKKLIEFNPGYRNGKAARATTYKIFPSKALRIKLRIKQHAKSAPTQQAKRASQLRNK